MAAPLWLWLGTVLNALLFVLGAYMAVSAMEIVSANPESGAAMGIAFLFSAAPVFALAGPMTAWRSHRRGRSRHAAAMMLVPLVYTAFLVLLLIFG